jgi:methionyl-tRNA formyltransferase
LVIETVRLDDGSELPALEFFGRGGGYLTDHP